MTASSGITPRPLAAIAGRIPGARIIGDGTTMISGMAYDSRRVGPGDLFCAIEGESVDGNNYMPQAERAGAVAVLTSSVLPNSFLPAIIVPEDRLGMALAAHVLYEESIKGVEIIGITGTNGKTTCAHILQSILNHAGRKTGRIGTVGWEFDGQGEALERTTPEAPDLLNMIAGMARRGAEAVVMEVTSIAMPMKRVAGFRWAGGLFTNFSQDHLDLHGSMEAYFEAKKDFFRMLEERVPAVMNLDDPKGREMASGLQAKVLTYGFNQDPRVKGELLEESPGGLVLSMSCDGVTSTLNSPYLGRFNASNVLGCAATALALGSSPDAIEKGVRHAPQVRGRMERVGLAGGVTAVIDYAHTPDALERALEALRPMTDGRLIAVVGAGGDRDRTKRPLMGEITARLSDLAVITSDNPRREEPDAIIDEVMAGIPEGEKVLREPDRRLAIKEAVEQAEKGDLVVILGKGHETYQEIEGVKHHFDDREEVLKFQGEPC